MPSPITVRILYRSGWGQTYLHYTLDGTKWTNAPGDKMTNPTWMGGKWSEKDVVISNPSSTKFIEFVPNDGESHWDNRPADTSKSKNYYIELPSTVPSSSLLVYTLFRGQISQVKEPLEKSVFIVTDLDGTLIGDDVATAHLLDEIFPRQLLPKKSALVYNTGRALDLFESLRKEKKLLPPVALIGSVGTEIYWYEEDNQIVHAVADQEWKAKLQGHGWDVKVVRKVGDELISKVDFAKEQQAHWRPDTEQNEFKRVIGCHVKSLEVFKSQLASQLEAANVKAQLIVSGHGDWRYLDILSPAAGKLAAMHFVRDKINAKWQTNFSHENTVACGDSGNDEAMMCGDELSIIVGNAQTELMDWYHARVTSNPAEKERIYVSKKSQARGIIEGLAHFGFLQSE